MWAAGPHNLTFCMGYFSVSSRFCHNFCLTIAFIPNGKSSGVATPKA
jgi:hypothetical protein